MIKSIHKGNINLVTVVLFYITMHTVFYFCHFNGLTMCFEILDTETWDKLLKEEPPLNLHNSEKMDPFALSDQKKSY